MSYRPDGGTELPSPEEPELGNTIAPVIPSTTPPKSLEHLPIIGIQSPEQEDGSQIPPQTKPLENLKLHSLATNRSPLDSSYLAHFANNVPEDPSNCSADGPIDTIGKIDSISNTSFADPSQPESYETTMDPIDQHQTSKDDSLAVNTIIIQSQNPQHSPIEITPASEQQSDTFIPQLTTTSIAQKLQPGKVFHSNITICYHNISVMTKVPFSIRNPSILDPIINSIDAIKTLGKSCLGKDFYRIKDVSGVIRPGMTLILAPSGHGKSTFVRALAARIKLSSGKIVYNGRTHSDALKEGCDLHSTNQLVCQIDQHLTHLTVFETLDFAHKMTSINYSPQHVEDTIAMLGLEECRDTIVGDTLTRGISGGQQKRLTIAEGLLAETSTIFLDEYSNGLDASTAEDIGKGLQKLCQKYNYTIISTLQQPAPELLQLFDKIIILRDGQVVYDGPVCDVLLFFAAMGFNAPEDVDTADFVIDCLTQPRSVLLQQQHNDTYNHRISSIHQINVSTDLDTTKQEENENDPTTKQTSSKSKSGIETSYGLIPMSPFPCLTTEQMVKYYQKTPFYTRIIATIEQTFNTPIIPSNPQSDASNPKSSQLDTICFATRTTPIDGSDTPIGYHPTKSNPNNPTNQTKAQQQQEQREQQQKHQQHAPLFPTIESKSMFGVGHRLSLIIILLHLISRQFKIVLRNTTTLFPRIILAFLMSIIFGTLYWDIGVDSYILRLSSFTIIVAQTAFGNFVEIPLAARCSCVLKKQIAAGFYPAWLYTLAAFIAAMPMCILESVVYASFLYWMTNAFPSAIHFIYHTATLICTSLFLSSWFRFISAVGGDEQSAQSLGVPSTGLMMVLSPLFVSAKSVPQGLLWLYWMGPFSWACRSMANIEYLSPRYDTLVPSAPIGEMVRIGDVYLKAIDIENGMIWVVYGCIYLIGLSIVVSAFNAMVLHTRYYEESIGTRRDEQCQDELNLKRNDDYNDYSISFPTNDQFDQDPDVLHDQLQAAAIQMVQQQYEISRLSYNHSQLSLQIDHKPELASTTTTTHSTTTHSKGLDTLNKAMPFTPAWLSFSNVSYTVQVQKNNQTVDRRLLNRISGYAQPGKMLALIGASGAGKTTLLDVIGGLKNTGQVEGNILINGLPLTKELISTVTGYVEQFDTLFPYETVYDTLLFAARMRLPSHIDDTTKKQIVEEVIDILDLQPIRGLIIKKTSQSQCKIVNIGVELVSSPSILLLDEPTTGLCSNEAQNVMKVVKRIARGGRAIICTIHQPSAELFFLFDRMLLLGAGGHQIYFGDLGHRAQTFIKYLSKCPGVSPIKPCVNPATWMLVELGVGVPSADKKNGLNSTDRHDTANHDPDTTNNPSINPNERSIDVSIRQSPEDSLASPHNSASTPSCHPNNRHIINQCQRSSAQHNFPQPSYMRPIPALRSSLNPNQFQQLQSENQQEFSADSIIISSENPNQTSTSATLFPPLQSQSTQIESVSPTKSPQNRSNWALDIGSDEPDWDQLTPAQQTIRQFSKLYSLSEECYKTRQRIDILESIEIIDLPTTNSQGSLPNENSLPNNYSNEAEMANMIHTALKNNASNQSSGQVQHLNHHHPPRIEYSASHMTTSAPTSHRFSQTCLPTKSIPIPPRQRALWYQQARFLLIRNFSAYWHNPSFLYFRYISQTIFATLFGFLYWNIEATDISSATSLIGAIFVAIAFSCIGLLSTFIACSYETKPTFYREKDKYYAPSWWAVSQLLIELVWIIPSLIVTVLPTYFMIGFVQDSGVFWSFVFFCLWEFIVHISIAMVLSSIAPTSGSAMTLGGAFVSFSLAISGVVITSPHLPKLYSILYHILPLQHGLQALIIPQFRFNTSIMTVIQNGVEILMPVQQWTYAYLGWEDHNIWIHALWIGLFILGCQTVVHLSINLLAFNKR